MQALRKSDISNKVPFFEVYLYKISNLSGKYNTISNDKMYNIINFYKTFIHNFVNVFPNIILNEVDYKNTVIPNYLGLSKHHSKKIKDFISDYYKKLHRYVHNVYKKRAGFKSIKNIFLNPFSINAQNLRSAILTFYYIPAAIIDSFQLKKLEVVE
jgi:hypothetical protein